MGVKKFREVFDCAKEISYDDFKGKNIVIDASVEIYRSALAMKVNNSLTDKTGKPSIHINVILLGVILKLKACGANQFWVFDYDTSKDKELAREFHNPLKQLELQKRREKRQAAVTVIRKLKSELDSLTIKKTKVKTKDEELFSDESDIDVMGDDNDIDIDIVDKDAKLKQLREKIDSQEKIAFEMKRFYTEDTIFMLNMLDIQWMECPPAYEAEQIAAFTTNSNSIFGVQMDYVLSTDADCLLFGARKLIKRDTTKKKLFEYDLYNILTQYNLDQDELIKVGLILGTDFADKTPRIGPKTVLKKFRDIELTADQEIAYKDIFKKKLTNVEINSIVVENIDKPSFSDMNKYNDLLIWLKLVKTYNSDRIDKLFKKAGLYLDEM
jgi:hypothetical protein